jgi:hypothetical protein
MALKSLRLKPDLVVKPADKNLGLTVMDRSWYTTEALRQLSDTTTYERHLQPPDTRQIYDRMTTLTTPKWGDALSSHEKKYILNLAPAQARVPHFYLLPKLHKLPVKGRPIVASHSWVTTWPSKWVDKQLQPHLSAIPTYLRDSRDLLILLEKTKFPQGITLFTADVNSLYTNIPHTEGIQAVRDFLPKTTRSERVAQLLEFVLKNNWMKFGEEYYHQIQGTAMGTNLAPPYANIFMHSVESQFLTRLPPEVRANILVFKRYIDDLFGIVLGSRQYTEALLQQFNTIHPKIQITWEISEVSADFLDLHIYKGERFAATGLLDVSTHQKRMNKYLYIPYASYHHSSAKKSFIYAELLRYVRNSSSAKAYYATRQLFWQRLRERGYPAKFLLPVFQSVFYHRRAELLSPVPAEEQLQPWLLKIPHTPRTEGLKLRQLLTQTELPAATPARRAVICRKKTTTVQQLLCSEHSRDQPVASFPQQ